MLRAQPLSSAWYVECTSSGRSSSLGPSFLDHLGCLDRRLHGVGRLDSAVQRLLTLQLCNLLCDLHFPNLWGLRVLRSFLQPLQPRPGFSQRLLLDNSLRVDLCQPPFRPQNERFALLNLHVQLALQQRSDPCTERLHSWPLHVGHHFQSLLEIPCLSWAETLARWGLACLDLLQVSR